MTLEVNIEHRGGELLKGAGCLYIKLGQEGWPDRLVIYAPGKHFWIEWKQPGGQLTPAQKARLPRMKKTGEPVYLCVTPEQAMQALWLERER